MHLLTTEEIDRSHEKLKSLVLKTPLITNERINEITKARVYFKLENLQRTGSFKLRGAGNKISQLSEEERSKGVVAYSSGNHAQAVAYMSKLYNIKATIVMPRDAPSIKINNTKKYGANVVLYDSNEESREEVAKEIALNEKKTLIKPYDDLQIITGQGTVGKEIAEQLNEIKIEPNIFLCCCGGGGLIAGSSFYLKKIFPKIKNFSVEPQNFNDTQLSLLNNKICSNKKFSESICDALLAKQPGKITFSINEYTLEGGLTVTDQEVKETIIKIAENMKIIVEPGGAVAAAALLNNKINIENKNVIVMISGGNIDHKFFSSIVNEIL